MRGLQGGANFLGLPHTTDMTNFGLMFINGDFNESRKFLQLESELEPHISCNIKLDGRLQLSKEFSGCSPLGYYHS